jgi:simple sugar transport system substrate-binding protein
MTDFNRRWLVKLAALATVSTAALLAGCSKKEEAPAAAEPMAASEPAMAASAPAPAASEPLKVGFIYLGPVTDAGWTYAHDQARKEVEAKFGDKIKVTTVDKVPEGPDSERVIRDLVSQGNKLIFATSFGYGDSMAKVAKDFPDVYFEHATGFKTAPNLRDYEAKFYESAYLAGIIAGKMTKTNTLGFVASFPVPEVMRNLNAYLIGAQSVNPKAKLKVIWVSSWFDPPKEAEAAQTLINGGADVLLQNTDSSSVLQTAEKNGKYAFGWDSDMSAFAPKAHLGSAVLTWAVYYEKAINDVLNGTWKTGDTKWGMKEGMNDFVKIPDTVPEDVRKMVDTAKAGLKDGSLAIFKGPLYDNEGKEVLAKDVVADDAWLSTLNLYLKGVEGKAPTSK